MEKKMNKIAKETLLSDKVSGIVVSDTNGLCMLSDGLGDKNLSPTLLKIIQFAEKLDESKQDSMAIRLDCLDYHIDLKHHKNIIAALYKRY